MARSAALNPASMPFFPGGIRPTIDEGGNGLGWSHPDRQQGLGRSPSTHSISPAEYRPVKSSPSPRIDHDSEAPIRIEPQTPADDGSQGSPRIRSFDAVKLYPGVEVRVAREASMLAGLDHLPEGSDSSGSGPAATIAPAPGPVSLAPQPAFEHRATPPVPLNSSSRASFHTNGAFSSSPVSSLDSASHFASSIDHAQSLDSQLTASPMIHDILQRLVQCEYSTREIQRDLGDMHRKVNMLVERSLGMSAMPEFKDPFAPGNAISRHFSPPPLNGHRPSISGNIAPNQTLPSDDILQISQRLNTLTTSVGQLLALQTQQHLPPGGLQNPHLRSSLQPDLAPNSVLPSHLPANHHIIGHGMPTRPDMRSRAPNHPSRTWSAGALELPMRPTDAGQGRQDGHLRDKRRSASGVSRRDSSVVRS